MKHGFGAAVGRVPSRLRLLFVAVALAFASPSAAAPTPNRVELEGELSVRMGDARDAASDSVLETLPPSSPLALELEAIATEGNSTARALESIQTSFDAFTGSVNIDMLVEIDNPDRLSATGQIQGNHDPWSFRFVNDDVARTLVFDYDVSGMNIRFRFNNSNSERLLGSGSLTRELREQTAYTLTLDLFAGPNCSGICNGSFPGSGVFSWRIVPEPSTVTLVGAGLVACGLAGRSRRAP